MALLAKALMLLLRSNRSDALATSVPLQRSEPEGTARRKPTESGCDRRTGPVRPAAANRLEGAVGGRGQWSPSGRGQTERGVTGTAGDGGRQENNAEIGRGAVRVRGTVKTHARRLFRKLGARDRAHAVAAAFQAGLVR